MGIKQSTPSSAEIRLYRTEYFPGNMVSGLATLTFPPISSSTNTSHTAHKGKNGSSSSSSASAGGILAGRIRVVGVETVSTGPKVGLFGGGFGGGMHDGGQQALSVPVHEYKFYEETLTLFGEPPKGTAMPIGEQRIGGEEQKENGGVNAEEERDKKQQQEQVGHFKYPFAFHLPRYLPPSTNLWASGHSHSSSSSATSAGESSATSRDDMTSYFNDEMSSGSSGNNGNIGNGSSSISSNGSSSTSTTTTATSAESDETAAAVDDMNRNTKKGKVVSRGGAQRGGRTVLNDRGVSVFYFVEVRLKVSAEKTLTFRREFHVAVPIDLSILKPSIPRMAVGRTVRRKILFNSNAPIYVPAPHQLEQQQLLSVNDGDGCRLFPFSICTEQGGQGNGSSKSKNTDAASSDHDSDGDISSAQMCKRSNGNTKLVSSSSSTQRNKGFVDVSVSSTRKFFVPGDTLEGELIIDNSEGLVHIDSLAVELHVRADLVFPLSSSSNSNSTKPTAENKNKVTEGAAIQQQGSSSAASASASSAAAVGLSHHGGSVYGPSMLNMSLVSSIPPGETVAVPLLVPIPNVIHTPSYPAKGSRYYLRHEVSIKLNHVRDAIYLPIHISGGSTSTSNVFSFIPNDQCCAALTAKAYGRKNFAYALNGNNSLLLTSPTTPDTDTEKRFDESGGSTENEGGERQEVEVEPAVSTVKPPSMSHLRFLRPPVDELPAQPVVPKSSVVSVFP